MGWALSFIKNDKANKINQWYVGMLDFGLSDKKLIKMFFRCNKSIRSAGVKKKRSAKILKTKY